MADIQENRRRYALNISMLVEQTKNMITSVKNGEENLEIKYNYLFENTPSIFMLLKDNSIEEEQIPFLMHMFQEAEKVQEGKANAYETDVAIGKTLAEKYILPRINKQ